MDMLLCTATSNCNPVFQVRYKSDCDEDLSANNIDGSFPYGLPPNLTNLNLAENKLGHSITYSFEKMKHLQSISHNFLTGPLDDVLHGLENLKLMDLSFNSFTGEIMTSFGSLTNLTGFCRIISLLDQ
ncbi:hypothetical protein OROMI_033992 [Orobanche minor]